MSQVPVTIRDIEETSHAIEELRVKIQSQSEQRAQAFFQLRECQIVLDEFKYLDDTDVIMKQSGPTLMKQDINDARENIQGRIKFIENQLKTIDASIEQSTKQLTEKEDILRKVSQQQQ